MVEKEENSVKQKNVKEENAKQKKDVKSVVENLREDRFNFIKMFFYSC